MYRSHKFIDAIHVYESKLETWLKFMCLAVSFFGGLYGLASASGNTQQYGIAFFIYSIALFMEYLLKLTSPTEAAPKIFPLVIILCGMVLFVDSVAYWSNNGKGAFGVDHLQLIAVFPVLVLFIDAMLITLVEKHKPSASQSNKPESCLRNLSLSEV